MDASGHHNASRVPGTCSDGCYPDLLTGESGERHLTVSSWNLGPGCKGPWALRRVLRPVNDGPVFSEDWIYS